MYVASHAKITQKKTSLLFLEKEVRDEVDFLHVDKHESFQQIDFLIFDEDGQAFSNLPKKHVSNVFTIPHKRS